MSTTIDSKVVEMRFDNAHFEKHTRETMSTLDKLKQKLNFKDSAKGLENLNTASNKVNMSGMSTALDTVNTKFSALQIVGTTALVNITNSAVNAGKRIAKALTIEPVMTGFKEYETQINAVQTILANTQKEGTDITKVNAALDELNKYADKTIYNFTEMTRNIGTFTAAGVKLDTSVNAIKGIANLAAVSGSTSQQASTAMYQLSQALASGTVKLMDWNSVVNAGMGGQVFQDALKETARVHGINIDKMIKDQGSFRETLKDGWLTSEILTETLEKFTLTTEGLTEAEIKANRERLKAKGYTEAQIDEIFKLGATATDAATKVKTFTQLFDVLKEAAQSGWSQTWRILVGDFEEAKALLTPLATFFTGVIDGISNFRNGILELAMGSPLAKFAKTFSTITEPITETVKTIRMSVEEIEKMANQVIRGNWGNGKDRFNALTKAGYNHYAIQNRVNEKLGDGFRHSEELIESQYRLLGATEKTTEAEKSSIKSKEELIIHLAKMSKAELEAAGYTEDQIEALQELRKYAKMTGLSIEDLVKNLDNFNGRWLMINSFKNIGQGLVAVFTAIKDAWREAFFGEDSDKQTVINVLAKGLFKLIAAFHKFTTYLTVSEKGAKNLKDTFRGLFSILDIILTIIGGPIKIALKILGQLFKALDISAGGVLAFTGAIGRAISRVHDWFESIFDLTGIFEFLAPFIELAAEAVKKWFKSFKQSKVVTALVEKLRSLREELKKITKSDVINFFKKLGTAIKNIFTKINDHFGGVPGDILSGLAKGLKNGAGKVINAILTLASNLVTKFKEFLGIHSPSKVFFAIGGFIIAGLIGGLLSGSTNIGDTLGSITSKIAEFFQNTDWGNIFSKLFTGGMSIGLLMVAKNLSDTVKNFSSLAGGLGSMFDGVGDVARSVSDNMKRITKAFSYTVKSFGKVLKGIAFKKTAEGIKELAWSILIIAGAIALLTMVDTKKMWQAVGALSVMTIVLGALAAGVAVINSKLESGLSFEKGKGLQIKGFKSVLIQIAVAILAMALVLKTIGKMDPEQYEQGLDGLTRIITLLGGLLIVFGLVARGDVAKNMDKAADMFKKFGVALVLMAITIKLIGGMDYNQLVQGGNAIFHFALVIAGLMAATKLIIGSKNVDKIGGAILKIAGALMLMALVVKVLGGMDAAELKQGGRAIFQFAVVIAGLMAATKLITGSTNVDKIGGALLKISAALLIMAVTTKILGGMDTKTLIKGGFAIAAFAGIIALLMWATQLITGSTNVGKIGLTLLAMSGAIAIMAATALILSLIDLKGLAKGVIAIGLLGAVIALMLKATKGAKDVKGSLIAMSVAIGIMAASIAILSFIKPEKLIAPTLAMSALMGMFALVAKSTKNVTKAFGTLIVMTAAVGVLAIALGVLSRLPAENVIGAAIGLSILMLAMSGVFLIISKMGSLSAKALLGIAGIAALSAVLYILVDVLKRMDGIQNAAQNATVLGIFMGVLAVVLLLTAAVGAIYTATAGIAATGLLGMVAIIGMLYMVLGVLAIMNTIPNAISNLETLQNFLITMTEILVTLAIVGPLALTGVTAMYGLTALMVVIGTLAVAVAALMEKFPSLKDFLDKGLPVLIKLAGGIGQMIGAFVGGIMTKVASTLPFIGLMLSQFMVNALPFIHGAKLINDDVIAGVGALAAAILILTAADLISGVASFMSGGESFAELGTELSNFMTNALPFINASYLINPKLMEGVKTLAQAILILTGAELIQGLTSWLTGGASLSEFGDQLPGLAEDLSAFVTSLGTFTEAQVTTTDCAGRAIKALAEAAKEIPNEGGLWGALCGENSLATFSSYLPGLGSDLAEFVKNLGTFTEAQVTTTDCAGRAIKALAEAAKEIPNEGGLWGAICGENSLATFSGYLPGLGSDLSSFVSNLGTFSDPQLKTIDCACAAIKALAEAAKEIPNEGGLWAKIFGENSLATFGDQLPELAKDIKDFITNLGTFGEDKIATVNAACKAIQAVAGLGKIDMKTTADNLGTFGSKMISFGKNVKSFIDQMAKSSADKINESIKKTEDLIAMAKSVADIKIESLKTFGESLKSIAKDGVNGFVKEFNGESPKSKAEKAGGELVTSAKEGIEDKKKTIKEAATKVSEAAIDNFCTKSLKSDAKIAGQDLATGFANGISSDESIKKVSAAGTTIGKEALKAAKKAIDSNSPSKEAMKIGNDFDNGFIIGIEALGSKVYNTAYGVADQAKTGLSKAISRVSNLINSDIDAQPTIRPVLDLSEIESGAGYLNTMFNNGPSIGVTSNLNAISSGMNSRIQNGANSEVVSAINKLRKDLGSVGGDTYNINGVSYADTDTDINNAVRTLVRAATIERRI